VTGPREAETIRRGESLYVIKMARDLDELQKLLDEDLADLSERVDVLEGPRRAKLELIT
jgi:hypothetical protein